MTTVLRDLGRWLVARLDIRSDRGATAVEYGLMLALIAAVIILAVVFLGQETSSSFECTGQSIRTQADQC